MSDDARVVEIPAELTDEQVQGFAERLWDVNSEDDPLLSLNKADLRSIARMLREALAESPSNVGSTDQAGSAKAAGAPGAESTAAPTNTQRERENAAVCGDATSPGPITGHEGSDEGSKQLQTGVTARRDGQSNKCGDEDDCDFEPWCRIKGQCQKPDEQPVVPRRALAEWITRKAAELGDEPEPMACGGVLPSCLCCGEVGVPNIYPIDHPQFYVCFMCACAARQAHIDRKAGSAPVAGQQITQPCNEQCEPNGCAECPLDETTVVSRPATFDEWLLEVDPCGEMGSGHKVIAKAAWDAARANEPPKMDVPNAYVENLKAKALFVVGVLECEGFPKVANELAKAVMADQRADDAPKAGGPVMVQRTRGTDWKPWLETMNPRPPSPEVFPLPRRSTNRVDWGGLHFYAIRFPDGREWNAEAGWVGDPK